MMLVAELFAVQDRIHANARWPRCHLNPNPCSIQYLEDKDNVLLSRRATLVTCGDSAEDSVSVNKMDSHRDSYSSNSRTCMCTHAYSYACIPHTYMLLWVNTKYRQLKPFQWEQPIHRWSLASDSYMTNTIQNTQLVNLQFYWPCNYRLSKGNRE